MTPDDFQKLLAARDKARTDHAEACDDGEACWLFIASRYARLCELQDQIDAALAAEAQEET
jgi:hypothetical protein